MSKLLPDPTISFTIPSLHDDSNLECRIFHPPSLTSPNASPWHKHAAVVAHPYAPLGGCYDDPVVDAVAGTLLAEGYLIGTFNFRGAGHSKGRTSWTAKAERSDYMSFTGFLLYYIHYLDPSCRNLDQITQDGKLTPRAASHSSSLGSLKLPQEIPEEAQLDGGDTSASVFLFGGYSYGGMIATLLPTLSTILEAFASPPGGSAAAEIRLRAQHLAEQQNKIQSAARGRHPKSPRSPLRVGGDEDPAHSHTLSRSRKSYDARRSVDDAEERLRKSMSDIFVRKQVADEVGRHMDPVLDLLRPRPAYLLVSPPQGPVKNLACMTFSNPFVWRKGQKSPTKATAPADHRQPCATGEKPTAREELDEAERKLVDHSTLAIFGDQDVFVSAKRFRAWSARLSAVPGSRFLAHEVSTAGHFWSEPGVGPHLVDAVRTFGIGLLQGEDGGKLSAAAPPLRG